jgi:hypothetical protein
MGLLLEDLLGGLAAVPEALDERLLLELLDADF